MTTGTLVAALAQDTTTTTGTGAITLSGSVPAGSPTGTTTFAAAFPAVYPQNNIFYYISDGTNIEVGLGSLTGATTLTRDFVLLNQTSGAQTVTGTHVNFASGTKNVYSNPNLFATTAALWERFPNQVGGADGGYTEDLMSGTFTGVLTQSGATVNLPCRYKVSSSGLVTILFTATTQNTTGTGITITGIPAFLCNLSATQNVMGLVNSNGAVVLGNYQIAAGATPTTAGVITLQQSTGTSPIAFTSTFTQSVVNGVPATSITYPLF